MKKKEVIITKGCIITIVLSTFGCQRFPNFEIKETCTIVRIEEEKEKTIKIEVAFIKKGEKPEEKEIEVSTHSINFPRDSRILKFSAATDKEKENFKKLMQQVGL